MSGHSASPFGDRLRRLREASGMTQEVLAERAGLSRDAVSALERGHRRRPHPDTVRSLATALGLAEDDAAGLRALLPQRAPSWQPAGPEGQSFRPPPALTRLVGRQRELAELRQLLTGESVRLVTIVGPGGVGKTRLAVDIAADLAPTFAAGSAFVPLASVPDAALVAPLLAEALGAPPSHGDTMVRAAKALGDRRMLLVLDNLEHLPEAAIPLARFLEACPGLTVLATSRSPLRLTGEREYPLVPLAVPGDGLPASLAELAENDAVTLFLDRASAVDPGFTLTAENAAAVAAICARLDGLPLAIELAAARVKVLPPNSLLDRLQADLGLLSDGPRNQPERLRSLRAAIAWSYDLLSSADRALFRRLAVFEDGFSLEGAETVAKASISTDDDHPDHPVDVLGGVASLIDKSLLHRVADDGGPRFAMLATIREYALERLAAAGEERAVRAAHASWTLSFAESVFDDLYGMGQAAAVASLEGEHANVRAALRWAIDNGDSALALRLVRVVWDFWYVRGHLAEGRRWIEAALALPDPEAPDLRAFALLGLGQLALYQGDVDVASKTLQEAIGAFRDLGDVQGRGDAQILLGILLEDEGEYEAAEIYLTEAFHALVAAETAEPAARAFGGGHTDGALYHLGVVAYGRGDLDLAERRFQEALGAARAKGNDFVASAVLGYQGLIACERGQFDDAAVTFRLALVADEKNDDRQGLARDLANLAVLADAIGRAELAVRLLGAADAAREGLGLAPFPLPERGAYDRAAASARAVIGQEAFVALWRAGRAQAPERVVGDVEAVLREVVLCNGGQ